MNGKSWFRPRSWVLLLGITTLLQSAPAAAEVGLGLRAGFPVFPIPGAGADVFWSGRHFTLGVHYSAGALDFQKAIEQETESDEAGAILDKALLSTTLAMVEMRFFFLWGLNFSFGAGQRTIDFAYTIQDAADENNTVKGEIKTKSTISNVGLGVMGRWRHFYMGLDLVSVSVPQSFKAESKTTATGNLTTVVDAMQDDVTKIAEKLGKASSAQILMLSLGLLF